MESPRTTDTDRWQAAKRIFRAGVDLTAEEWPGFLDRECGDDQPLRWLVERLLASDQRATDPEHDPLPDLFSAAGSARPAPSVAEPTAGQERREPTVGQVVANYLILERLGAGGMGVVFRARDIHLEREVALKFLPSYLAEDPIALRGLIVEAQAAAALDDPRISTIFEIGGIESGNLFIAETFWAGETLAARLKRGPVPTDEALRIAAEIACGLAAAHTQGVVHRDIKPSNIQLTDDGQVKILDFGIAQSGQTADRPQFEQTPGTRAFMSPEQIRDEGVDGRTDIWSLGVVLYRMLVGSLPFQDLSREDLTHAILEQAPDPISDHLPESSKRLDWLVRTALRKNPKARFQSAEAFLEAIRKVRPETVVAPNPANLFSTPPSRSGFRPSTFAIGAMSLVALLLAIWVASAVNRQPAATTQREIRSIAVLPFVNLSSSPEDEPFVDGMTEALINSLGHIQDLRVMSSTSSMSFRGSEKTLTEIARELDVDAVIEGSILAREDRTRIVVRLMGTEPERQIWMHAYNRSQQDLFSLQRELTLAIAGEIQVALTPAEEQHLRATRRIDPQAQKLFLKARHVQNQGHSRAATLQAFEMLSEAIALEPDFAEALAELANIYPTTAHFNIMSPDEAYLKGQAAAEAALERDPSLVAAHLALMRYHLTFRWNWSDAETVIRNGLKIRPGAGNLHRGYAWYLATRGELEEALIEIETAAQLDPISQVIAVDRARMLFYLGRYPEAIRQSREILEIWPNSMGAFRFQGLAQVRLGQSGPGLASLRRSLQSGDLHALPLSELGYAQAKSGATADALEILSVLLEEQPAPSYQIAIVHAGLGDKEPALDWLERAYREHATLIPRMKVDPCLDSLREEPRFQAILNQIGLADSQIAASHRAESGVVRLPEEPRDRPWSQGSSTTSRIR